MTKRKKPFENTLRPWLAVILTAVIFLSVPAVWAEETVPETTGPQETVPQETTVQETVPGETVPEDTVPEDTEPETLCYLLFHYPDRTEEIAVGQGLSFSQMYPGIDPDSLTVQKEHHTFLGWYESPEAEEAADTAFDFFAPVTRDLSLYPHFQRNCYTVTFVVEGFILETQSVAHGEDAALPEIPEKEGFSGAWDHDGRNITADLTVTLVYSRVGSGMFRDVTGTGNFGGGWLSETAESLAAVIPMSLEEQAALEAGEDVAVRLSLEDYTAGVSPEEGALVQSVLGDMTLGMFLRASLYKTVGQDPERILDMLNGSVTVSLMLPQSLQPEEGTVRAFAVLRVHEGTAEAVDTAYNPETGVLSFSSDRLSTFAVIYTDAEQTPPPFTPDTSDPFRAGLWTACLALSACGLAAVISMGRKRREIL